ncbi:MAG: YvcK family protein [Candidatus Roizmanbacteria bacterium]|nr:YvcK family protein [Candidatus Roizmanbacteria bacterium]
MKNKNIVVIGGGTGTYTVLSGLKTYPITIGAIITMMDSGGSSGKLRDQYGVLPGGDVRQALVALSESDLLWRKLFLYRFTNGDFKGHNFGNLFLAVTETIGGNFQKALDMAQQLLHTKGKVIPVTFDKTNIQAVLEDGKILTGESIIDERVPNRSPINTLTLEKPAKVNPHAVDAIKNADCIVIGPGDVYTSLLPNFMFNELVHEYKKSSAKKVLIANLMNKAGQTDEFGLSRYVSIFSKYLGDNPFTHIVINTGKISEEARNYYMEYGEHEVIDDLTIDEHTVKKVKANLLSDSVFVQIKGDSLERSIVRHDPDKLAKILLELLYGN